VGNLDHTKPVEGLVRLGVRLGDRAAAGYVDPTRVARATGLLPFDWIVEARDPTRKCRSALLVTPKIA
jgi:hypothetical protein